VVHPLLPASGLLAGLLPAVARLPGAIFDGLGSLFSGPSETADRDPDFSGDDALVAQLALRDPSVRTALLKEIDRRLGDDVPEDPETRNRLERLRDVLRELETPEPAAAPSEEPPPETPPAPLPTRVVAIPDAPVRLLTPVAKGGEEALRVAAAGPSSTAPAAGAKLVPEAAGVANAEVVDRILRASRLVQSRGISRLRLVLEPPELGEVRLDLTLKDRVVHGAFSTDAPAAAEAVLARLAELKDALERRGLRVGELSVRAAGAEPAGLGFMNPFQASTSLPGNLDLKA
jgi:hypothetical protein